ncbi:MAG: ATP-binding cassette domain-containing protein [Pseudomonadota bacterium]
MDEELASSRGAGSESFLGLRRLRDPRGRDRCAPGRERRGQVHADNDHRRGLHPEAGGIEFGGERRAWSSPKEVKDVGIHIIYQDLMPFPEMTVAENIFIGAAPSNRLCLIECRRMHARAAEPLERLGHHLDPRALTRDLSVADQQVVAIAKALVTETKLLVLDEPTAVISGR